MPPLCICPFDKWLESPTQICSDCNIKCSSCINSEYECHTCSSNRVSPPDCLCPNGFFDNGIANEC